MPAICAEIFRRKQDMEKRKEFKFELSATLIEVAQRIEVEGVVERVESHDPRRGVPWLATIQASGLFLP